MFTEIHYPNYMRPEELDKYLANSWFRMGQMIFTCQFLCFNGELYTAVWTRLELDNYQYRKGLRKLMKRNGERFRVVVRKAVFNQEKEMLYQDHKNRFEGYVANSLKESLFGDADYNIYDTWEICVYDQYRLVAVSFFDKGTDSLASIMGLFDPDYQKYSLGFYTMLLEIQVGKEEGKQYYYPGYVVPDYGRFDYKLRVGDVEYFDSKNKEWKAYSSIDFDLLPSALLKTQLIQVDQELEAKGVNSKQILYPLYDKELYGHDGKSFIKNPMFVSCFHHPANPILLVIEYDLFKDTYQLSRVSKYEDTLSYLIYLLFEGFDEEKSYLEFLSREKVIAESSSMTDIVDAAIENSDQLNNHLRRKGEM